jgi:hypothetical protein
MIDSLLLTAVQICTFQQQRPLTNATSFFFERGKHLYLVTSRHVLYDEPSNHFPDRIEIELHVDSKNMAKSIGFSVPLYRNGEAIWRQGNDLTGAIDVAVIEIERQALPVSSVYRAFTPNHLLNPLDHAEIGNSLLVVGFPLGFHDTLHHLPIVRQGVIASSFGLRFDGRGYFLTDARTHRGTSGAPVVMRSCEENELHHGLPWRLLGIHSSRLDIGARDFMLDEALGLNCVWYSDILLTLTERGAETLRKSNCVYSVWRITLYRKKERQQS